MKFKDILINSHKKVPKLIKKISINIFYKLKNNDFNILDFNKNSHNAYIYFNITKCLFTIDMDLIYIQSHVCKCFKLCISNVNVI